MCVKGKKKRWSISANDAIHPIPIGKGLKKSEEGRVFRAVSRLISWLHSAMSIHLYIEDEKVILSRSSSFPRFCQKCDSPLAKKRDVFMRSLSSKKLKWNILRRKENAELYLNIAAEPLLRLVPISFLTRFKTKSSAKLLFYSRLQLSHTVTHTCVENRECPFVFCEFIYEQQKSEERKKNRPLFIIIFRIVCPHPLSAIRALTDPFLFKSFID